MGRVDPHFLAGEPLPDVVLPTDLGQSTQIIDVVGDRHPHHVGFLLRCHERHFMAYDFVRTSVETDARTHPQMGDKVVHQLLVLIDGVPLGFLLVDSNLRRRLACVHFLAVDHEARSVRIRGERLGAWLLALALALLERDIAEAGIGDPPLGLVGEAIGMSEVRLWSRFGLLRLDVPYREPIRGWEGDLDVATSRPASLLWLPPFGTSSEEAEHQAIDIAQSAAAAYYLDHYGFPTTNALVVGAIGSEADANGSVFAHRRYHV